MPIHPGRAMQAGVPGRGSAVVIDDQVVDRHCQDRGVGARVLPRCGLVAAALLWVALPAGADTGEAGASQVEIAVLDVVGSGPVDPQQVTGLSGVLAAEVAARPAVRITTSQDIRAVLGYEAERQLLDCDDDSVCLADLAGAMGVQYLLATEVSRVGRLWLLNMSLVDVEDARPIHRVSHRADAEEDLVDLIGEAVTALLSRLGIDGPGPVTVAPRRRAAPRPNVVALSALAAGGTAVVAGGILYGTAWGTHRQFMDGQTGTPTITWEQAIAAQYRAGWGVGLLAGGAALAASALVLPASGGGGPTVSLAPAGEGALVLVTFQGGASP
jgi:hypothetical protein